MLACYRDDVLRFLADIRSIITTARKHGLNILETITQPAAEIIAKL